MELFLGFIFYQYYTIEEEHLEESIFLQMKNYSLSFTDNRFDIDILSSLEGHHTYELYRDEKSLFILLPFPSSTTDILKVYYPLKRYQIELDSLEKHLFIQWLMLSVVALFIALLFSWYVLRPLREALLLLETFIKDIIHDLNTPLTSILINLKMMDKKSEEVESILQSAKTIAMLHHNLDNYLREMQLVSVAFDLKKSIEEQVAFFKPLYDYLEWRVEVPSLTLQSDPHAFARIVYNLLSNACKYNRTDGTITIFMKEESLCIANSSYGIKEPSRIFERFYKESERGLGIGLHIVEKLSDELHIEKEVNVSQNRVKICLNLHNILLK